MIFQSKIKVCVIAYTCGLMAVASPANSQEEDQTFLDRFGANLTVDNYGTSNSGKLRSTVVASLSNNLSVDDSFYIGYQTPFDHLFESSLFFAGYSLPWDNHFNVFRIDGYISTQEFATPAGAGANPFTGTYEGASVNGSYDRTLTRRAIGSGSLTQTLQFGLGYQRFDTGFDQFGNEFDASIEVLPGRVAYEIAYDQEDGVSGYWLIRYIRNINLGDLANEEEYQRNRLGSRTNFDLFRTAARFEYDFENDWLVSVEAFGQYANEPLVSSQSFYLGGIGSIRALEPGEAFGDSGAQVTVELITPALFEETNIESFGLAFLESSKVWRKRSNGLETQLTDSAVDLGIGIRWKSFENLSAELDLAYLLGGSLRNTRNRQDIDNFRLLFSASIGF